MRSFLTVLALLCGAVCHGQTGRFFPTVESIVAAADALYAGSIEDLRLDQPGDHGRVRRCKVSFRIDTTIKGPRQKTVDFEFLTTLPEEFLKDLAVKHKKFLVLTSAVSNPLTADLSKKMGASANEPRTLWFRLYEKGTERYQDWDHNVFTADLRVVGTFADLVKEAKAVSKLYLKPGAELAFYTPSNSVARMCGDPNAYAAVCVPKSPTTEELARRLITEPRKVVSEAIRRSRRVEQTPTLTSEDVWRIRESAVMLLGEFPSERNRELLRPLLKDESLRQMVEWALAKMSG